MATISSAAAPSCRPGTGDWRRGDRVKAARLTIPAGRSADWLKTKVCETGEFVISGFVELAGGRLDAPAVVQKTDAGALVPSGLVKFGFAGKGLGECSI